MPDDAVSPVIVGLVAGIALFLVFTLIAHENLTSIGQVSVGITNPDGGVRPEYNLRVSQIDEDMLTRNDMVMLKFLIDNAPPSQYFNPPYEDEITKQQAKQLMKALHFSNITSYVDPTRISPDFRVYVALVQIGSGGEGEYYRIFIQTSELPDNEISSFDITPASPPR